MKTKVTGAGFVLYFDNTNKIVKNKPAEILYLCLTDIKGKYDFPKGTIDDFEDPFDCAIRETFEETHLKHGKHFKDINKLNKTFSQGLVMFLGEYNLDIDDIFKSPDLNKNIKLLPNEKTNIIEHNSFSWNTFDKALQNLPEYLKEVLYWADKNI